MYHIKNFGKYVLILFSHSKTNFKNVYKIFLLKKLNKFIFFPLLLFYFSFGQEIFSSFLISGQKNYIYQKLKSLVFVIGLQDKGCTIKGLSVCWKLFDLMSQSGQLITIQSYDFQTKVAQLIGLVVCWVLFILGCWTRSKSVMDSSLTRVRSLIGRYNT